MQTVGLAVKESRSSIVSSINSGHQNNNSNDTSKEIHQNTNNHSIQATLAQWSSVFHPWQVPGTMPARRELAISHTQKTRCHAVKT